MKTVRKKGSVLLYKKNQLYGVIDLDTQEYLMDESPYIQAAKEVFEHYWRRKYSPMQDKLPHLYADDPKTQH